MNRQHKQRMKMRNEEGTKDILPWKRGFEIAESLADIYFTKFASTLVFIFP